MFFHDDPWVRSAVTDYHQRGGKDPDIDTNNLRADLQNGIQDGSPSVDFGNAIWSHIITPWRVAACVHELLGQQQAEDAAQIAGLYSDYVAPTHDEWRIALAGELMRLARAQ